MAWKGHRQNRRVDRIESINAILDRSDAEALFYTLCSQLEFCLPANELERLSASPPTNSDAFASAVFIAEGLDPVTSDRHLLNQVRQVVSEAFRKYAERVEQ